MTARALAARWWLALSLASLCVALLAIIGHELVPETTNSRSDSVTPIAQLARGPMSSFKMPPLTSFSEVTARPLFSPSRRPAAGTGVMAASSPFTLVGVVISPGQRHALLASGQPVRVSRVGEGEELGGWTVDEIRPGKVIVRHGDHRVEVKAKDFSHAQSPPAKGSAAIASVISNPVVSSDTNGQPILHQRPHDQ